MCVCVCETVKSKTIPPPPPNFCVCSRLNCNLYAFLGQLEVGGVRSSSCFVGKFFLIVRMLGLLTLIYSSADSNTMTLHAKFVVLSNLSGESGTGGGFDGSTSVVQLPLSLL